MIVDKVNYSKSLKKALSRFYTPEQVEEFAWHADIDKEESYRFDFVDHEGIRRHLVYWKEEAGINLYVVK